ncbi:MAG TPA: hypothetical protein VLF69_05805 [Candidatus Saccharimonadales bacterium]|nr:hypothetical protein [Candidatus Saccharimonadales bacterium]
MLRLGVGFGSLIALVLLLVLAFEIWMFVEAVKNPRLTDTERLLWCLGMLVIHPVVAIVYYFIEYQKV